MTTARRICTLASVTIGSLFTAIIAGPAAFAYVQPPAPGGGTPTAPVSHVATTTGSGGMLGWQIALIAIGAALVAALLVAAVDRFAFYRRLAHETV